MSTRPTSYNYWESFYARESPLSVEATAYVLLYLVQTRQLNEALPVMKWLVSQRNSLGGFTSTQDTVIGLQVNHINKSCIKPCCMPNFVCFRKTATHVKKTRNWFDTFALKCDNTYKFWTQHTITNVIRTDCTIRITLTFCHRP